MSHDAAELCGLAELFVFVVWVDSLVCVCTSLPLLPSSPPPLAHAWISIIVVCLLKLLHKHV